MTLTRRYRFSSSHRLDTPALSAEENARVYGKCNNPYGHGHDYVLDITVKGPLDHDTGRIVDLDTLDGVVNREVVHAFEHRDLNTEIPEFRKVVPTTENLAVEIQRRLNSAWPSAFPALHKIRIQETKRNSFELT